MCVDMHFLYAHNCCRFLAISRHSCMSLQTLHSREDRENAFIIAFGCMYKECASLLIGFITCIVEYCKLYECIAHCIWCKYLVCTAFTAVSEAYSGE